MVEQYREVGWINSIRRNEMKNTLIEGGRTENRIYFSEFLPISVMIKEKVKG